MHIYTDANGKEYVISITGFEIRQLKKAGIDLGSPASIGNYIGNSDNLADVMLVLTEEERAKRDIDERTFLSSFLGDAIDTARSAFVDAYVEYLPKKERAAMRKLIDHAMKELDKMEAMIDAELLKGTAGESGSNT